MSVQELEAEVSRLSPVELARFIKWFEQFAVVAARDNTRSDWADLSAQGLARAYSDAEPEYHLSDLKER
jgi:hypothetical protein